MTDLTQEEKVAHIKEIQKELYQKMVESDLAINRIKNDEYKPYKGVSKAEAIKAFQKVYDRSTELYKGSVDLLEKASRGEKL